MPISIKQYSDRIDQLIDLADRTLATKQSTSGMLSSTFVSNELFYEFRTSSLSFILKLYGEHHPYFTDFDKLVVDYAPHDTQQGKGILKSIKAEIDNGWLISFKGLVSSEIFTDFLEMAEHLLNENYKDPAAVMIGSVLEEHLRQLCTKHKIPLNDPIKEKPKRADLLNSELSNADVYNKLDQKNVTAWLDLRNKAAHGRYTEYNQLQVEHLLKSVTEFISRNSL